VASHQVRIFDLVRLEEHHRDLMLFDVNNRLVAQVMCVARWSGGQVARWSGGQVARW
jgi:hypothetical protein